MIVSDDKAAAALNFLSSTDEQSALAKVEVERCALRQKKERARAFLEASGSNDVRKAIAERAESVGAADDRYVAAVIEFETLRTQRETRDLQIRVWQSEGANRRQGG